MIEAPSVIANSPSPSGTFAGAWFGAEPSRWKEYLRQTGLRIMEQPLFSFTPPTGRAGIRRSLCNAKR
jgi:hypothetical protein